MPRPPAWLRASTVVYAVLFFTFLFLPLAVVAVFAFNDAPYPAPPWRGFTLDWFIGACGHHPARPVCRRRHARQPLDQCGGGELGHAAVGAGGHGQCVPARAHAVSGKQALSLLMLAPLVIPGVILGISILAFASRLAKLADDLGAGAGIPAPRLAAGGAGAVFVHRVDCHADHQRAAETLRRDAGRSRLQPGCLACGGVVDHHAAVPETGADRRGGDLVPDVASRTSTPR
jgi:hypothetical protein